MTFDQYDYIKANTPAAVKKVLQVSGLSQMNSLVSRAKSMQYPAIMVEDAPDLKIDLEEKNFEDQQHTFYVILYAAADDDSKRAAAYKTALQIGKQLLVEMQFPSHLVNVDKSDILVFKVGPLGDNAYGYGFSYGVSEE